MFLTLHGGRDELVYVKQTFQNLLQCRFHGHDLPLFVFKGPSYSLVNFKMTLLVLATFTGSCLISGFKISLSVLLYPLKL